MNSAGEPVPHIRNNSDKNDKLEKKTAKPIFDIHVPT